MLLTRSATAAAALPSLSPLLSCLRRPAPSCWLRAGVAAAGCPAAAPACSAPPCLAAPSRAYGTITRRRRKEMARAAAAEMRGLLSFAARYDHMRTARLELSQTLSRLGWAHVSPQRIADGVEVEMALRDHFCAFTIVAPESIVPPGHPEASTTPACPPLPRNAQGAVIMPHESPYPSAPPPWANPALGQLLDKATAQRHAFIRAKGWSLVAIPLPLWRLARRAQHQHYARRDLLMSMTLPVAPFQLRPDAAPALGPSKPAPLPRHPR